MEVWILRGISGAGKSTAAAMLQRFAPGAIVVSADKHFVGADGVYRFGRAQLPAAHGACLRSFVTALQAGDDVIVDNTNLSATEIAPYWALTEAYGAQGVIVEVPCDPGIAAARNVHGVPAPVVERMVRSFEAREGFLPWWKITTIGELIGSLV